MTFEFTYKEAILALYNLVAWADDEIQKEEKIQCKKMMKEEIITEEDVVEFGHKWDAMGSEKEVFTTAIEALKKESKAAQIKACAWMWQVANASEGVDAKEKEWVEKLQERLGVSSEELNKAYLELPDPRKEVEE